jgi:hypothetical protein
VVRQPVRRSLRQTLLVAILLVAAAGALGYGVFWATGGRWPQSAEAGLVDDADAPPSDQIDSGSSEASESPAAVARQTETAKAPAKAETVVAITKAAAPAAVAETPAKKSLPSAKAPWDFRLSLDLAEPDVAAATPDLAPGRQPVSRWLGIAERNAAPPTEKTRAADVRPPEPAPAARPPAPQPAVDASQYKVTAIMLGGARHAAIINGCFVSVGEEVGDAKVIAISQREVELEIAGQRVKVRL